MRRAAALAGWLLLAAAPAWAAGPVERGERVYREGLLASGAALDAVRENETRVSGATAACVNCHRRSGLGNVEGNYVVPPITAKYLLRSSYENVNDLGMAHVEGYHQGHVPYDDASLARAIRSGVGSDGRTLSRLMPRYDLGEADMADLTAYLHQLGSAPVPGVSEKELQFATVVAPDADPAERAAMLEVLERFFATQADVIAAETRPMHASREIKYRVTRRWRLHVWELHGDAATWEAQLRERQQAEPVFAIVSGIGRHTWEPVQSFCEHAHVPCLFPNVDLPMVREDDFYSVYFSRGVLLEADLLAAWLQGQEAAPARGRIVQVYRAGDIGAAAAARLRQDAPDLRFEARELPVAGERLAAALDGLGPEDTLVLWLRAEDLPRLPQAPPAAGRIVLSGLLGGMEAAPLPADWRARARMSYPQDLPERRLARMNFPFGWMRVQHIAPSAERVQVNTYLACVITAETVGHLFDSFVPEYLLERLEMMVSRRLANAYYPRLGLAPGQRFASKGGYVVHLERAAAAPNGAAALRVVADSDWIVP